MNEKQFPRKTKPTPKEACVQVRIALLKRGYTLKSFADAHGYSVATVWRAARRGGRRAASKQIAEHLTSFINNSK